MSSSHDLDRRPRWLPRVFTHHEHDEGHPVDAALESSHQGIRTVKLSLIGLGLTALAQLAVTLLTGSVALLSDTLHNLADAASALPVPIGRPRGAGMGIDHVDGPVLLNMSPGAN